MLDELTDNQLYDLIRDHWREIKGLAKEIERRKQKIVSTTNQEPEERCERGNDSFA